MRVLGPAVWLELIKAFHLVLAAGWALMAMYRPKVVEPEGVLDYFSRETGIWLYGYPIVIV